MDYRVADLFDLPADWADSFDLVLESMTVQSMPRSVRDRAIAAIRATVAAGGRLLVLGVLLPDGADRAAGPPWLLDRAELATFTTPPLRQTDLFEEAGDDFVRYRVGLVGD